MNTRTLKQLQSRGMLALLAGIGLLIPASQVKAQDDAAYPLAPPVDYYNAPASVNNVFNWADVPQNQVVPITRAVFDQGGYQLYDQAGETIVVPFQGNNLYVMKFAVSETGDTYFVNDQGQAPVLYLPEGAYLENATVPGARWYPFNREFCPSRPVFLGIAPSYSDYIDMGWYSGEVCRGGFYGSVSFLDGGFFGPTLGLTFIFGGHSYHGWDGYREYADNYPAPYRVGYFHRDYYQYAGRPDDNRAGSFSGVSGRTQYPSGGFNNGRNEGLGGRGQYPGGGRSAFNGVNRQNSTTEQYPLMNRPSFGGTAGGRSSFGGGNASRQSFDGRTAARPSFGDTQAARQPFQGGRGFGSPSAARTPVFSGSQPARNSGFGNPSFSGANGSTFGGRSSFGSVNAPRPSFGGSSESRPSFGGGQMPRSNNAGNFPAPRANNAPSNPAPRNNDNAGNSQASRNFGSFNGGRGFDR